MKTTLRLLSILALVCLYSTASSQCGAGYTQATLKWDNVDYYYNSGSNTAPYGFSSPNGNYVTNAMEQTQRFAIGTTAVTLQTSAAGIVKGENASHTGNIAGYTGEDAQFVPTANGQTITMTFDVEVSNVSFTLYDVDDLANFNFTAKNAANIAQTLTGVKQSGSVLTLAGSGTVLLTASTANNTNQGNSSNAGTVTVTVAGPVKSITITIATVGGDDDFWLSDIIACVPGTLPTNYNRTGSNEPFAGQPDYILVTGNDDGCFRVDPATGKATLLFRDPEHPYMNSMAYDPYNHIVYYVSENTSPVKTNKKLKKYDVTTGVISTIVADVNVTFNMPTFDVSLESGGGCFYNGSYYFGVEGGQNGYSSTPRENMIFRINFDASGNAINAEQVWATNTTKTGSNTLIFDWADFVIRNGMLYNMNSRTGTTNISYTHTDLMTGATTKYNNPGNTAYANQSAIDWAGNIYTVSPAGITKYNENGTNAATTVGINGGGYVGGAGDAAENFRPMMDFGDAPASYDPVSNNAAVHEQDPSLKLGSNIDSEWVTKGQTALANADSYDDALSYVSTFNPVSAEYLIQATVFNNSGANATVGAWLDYNGNGVFDAAEGITVTVPSNAAPQTIWLYWNNISSTLPQGTYTYLRIRITKAANGMTTSKATGWFDSGEVEDYRVPVNNYALALNNYDFDAELTQARSVQINWIPTDESNTASYIVEKSTNGTDWKLLTATEAKGIQGTSRYDAVDNSPAAGINYYRIKFMQKDGRVMISNIRKVDNKTDRFSITLAPNPARSKANVYIRSMESAECTVDLINAQGMVVYRQNVKLVAGTNAVPLPVESSLPAGRYVVRVNTGSETFSQSLIVNK